MNIFATQEKMRGSIRLSPKGKIANFLAIELGTA